MTTIEFFLDPICPFAWITSRWVKEVQSQIDLDVRWRFISLRMVNARAHTETDLPPEHSRMHEFGTDLLRVLAATRRLDGNDAVDRLYTEFGTRLHNRRFGHDIGLGADPGTMVADSLVAAGLPTSLAGAAQEASHDTELREETELAISRTGDDLGTPIITFDLDEPQRSSFFGPVLSRVPRDDEAVSIWQAVHQLAVTPGMAELKRSLRDAPVFD